MSAKAALPSIGEAGPGEAFMRAPKKSAGVGALEPFASGMQLVITGSGSALPDPGRGGASAAVVVDGALLQFDLGRMALENLLVAGLSPKSIDHLFFSHHHFDHIASLGYFLISNWIGGRQEMVEIMGPAGTEALLAGAYALHAGDLAFGGDVHRNWPADAPGRPASEPPYRARDIDEGLVLERANFTVRAMRTIHYVYPGAAGKSLAYRVDSSHGSVVISGDTGPMEEMARFAAGADILLHEAQRPDPGMTRGGKMARRDFSQTKSQGPKHGGGHASPSEIGAIAAGAGVKMLIATHLPPYTSVDAAVRLAEPFTGPAPGLQIWSDYAAAMKRSFDGKVVLAEDAMIFDVGAVRA